MAGSKNHKGAAAKAAEAKRLKEAAAQAAESDDDEEWVLDTTTPAILDASVSRVPATRKAVAQPPPLPELPSATRDKRGVTDESDERRRERYDKEKALIDRARRVAEGVALTGAKIAAGPYGEKRKKASHWEYVLCEMRWMARDFCAERDWKTECARRAALSAAARNGVPEAQRRDARAVEAAELARVKRRCAAVATEVALFWGKAWARASARPIPSAATLVPPKAKETRAPGAETRNGADGAEGRPSREPEPAETGGRPTRAAAARGREEAEKATETPAATGTPPPPKAEKEDARMTDAQTPEEATGRAENHLRASAEGAAEDAVAATPAGPHAAARASLPETPPPLPE